MKIAILGYGKEGKAAEAYFKKQGAEIEIFDKFTEADLDKIDFSCYNEIIRSPSVHPRTGFSSITRYFFANSPAPIIGVTGTKGKGTTCSLIAAILKAMGRKVYLIGNIGNPSIDILDELTPDDVVVYEMSSFQLWDLEKSPHVAVILRIEADHLNVHDDFDDYVNAKGNIAKYQTADDAVVYFKDNQWSAMLAERSAGRKISYPLEPTPKTMVEMLDNLTVPGEHNREDAEAALLAVAAFVGVPVEQLMDENRDAIAKALHDFKGLPHHIEFVRNLAGVDYYDDSFSASFPSLEVAVKAFHDRPVILIAGGKDRGLDLGPEKRAIFDAANLVKAVLIGETKGKLAEGENPEKYVLSESLDEAVNKAREIAEGIKEGAPVVLLSPGAASFDMFKDFYERGDKFKELVKGLK